jgi:autotransporter-associated beta strand protein
VFNGTGTNGSTGEISGKISGAGTITKAGPGTLIISNATNDFTASVSVAAGKLVTTNATALNAQGVTLSTNTTLQAQTGSGVALNLASLTTGTGSRIIIGA